MARFETAAQAIQQAALECGLSAGTNPYASTDAKILQMCGFLNSCGRELVIMKDWQRLTVTFTLTTAFGDSGLYSLPADYGHMTDQTQWNPTNRLPLGGPLSPQDWTYLVNSNLASSTIYISYREADGQFWILPAPPPIGQTINFEYNSRYWVAKAVAPLVLASDVATAPDDVVLYEPILIQKFLKLRFLEANGFDTTAAAKQFENMMEGVGAKDVSAPILNASNSRYFPYLDDRNVPETNYGLP